MCLRGYTHALGVRRRINARQWRAPRSRGWRTRGVSLQAATSGERHECTRSADAQRRCDTVSIHLMHEAARRRISPSAKLVLLCLAESARDGERRAWPGEQAMRTWAGISTPRLYAVLKDLAELRLIEQVKRGQKYQRAEYVVFPDGCCDQHPALSDCHSREADNPVDSLESGSLNRSQALVPDVQGLVSDVSGCQIRQPSLKTNPLYSLNSSSSTTEARPELVPAPQGIFDGVRARLADKEASA